LTSTRRTDGSGVYQAIHVEGCEFGIPNGEWTFDKLYELAKGYSEGSAPTAPSMEIIKVENGRKLRHSDYIYLGMLYVFRSKVIRAMGSILQSHGRLLPISSPQTTDELTLFRPNIIIDALDLEKSSMRILLERLNLFDVECPVFRPEIIEGVDIFTVPQGGSAYFSYRFVRQWQESGLTGMQFVNTADMTPGWRTRGNLSIVR
jgi:hypothetical protein